MQTVQLIPAESEQFFDFDFELLENNVKPTTEEFNSVNEPIQKKQNYTKNNYTSDTDYCVRTGIKIPFDTKRPFCYEAFQSWILFENWDCPEKYCHRTGKISNGKTSLKKPILF